MFYQTTYQLNGNITKQNISSVVYYSDDDTYAEVSEDSFPFHCHSYYEIIFMMEGYSEMESLQSIVSLRPGCFVLYTPYSMHCICKDCSRKTLILQFSPRLLRTAFSGIMDSPCLVPDKSLEQIGSLFASAGTELHDILMEIAEYSHHRQRLPHTPDDPSTAEDNSPETELALTSAVYKLINYLVKKKEVVVEDSDHLTNNDSKIQNLMYRIIKDPAVHISMEEAAASVGMSYSNFSRAFKDTTAMTYVDFCNMVRVQKAQELLSTTSLSTAEISQQLNFGAFSYFTRMFKRYTGKTPSDYRMKK